MVHPLFGLFAEPASTLLVTADPVKVAAIEELADNYRFHCRAHRNYRRAIGLKSRSYGEPFISAPLERASQTLG